MAKRAEKPLRRRPGRPAAAGKKTEKPDSRLTNSNKRVTIPEKDRPCRTEVAMAMQRLDKIISSAGRYSRRQVSERVRRGEVLVNGVPARSPAEKADPERDVITVSGETVEWKAARWIMMNKPAGVLSATEDGRDETVLDLLPEEYRRMGLFPAGRLDRDTVGLLLLTDDGDYAHRVISPNRHVWKEYYAETEGTLLPEHREAVERGLKLPGLDCLPARLEILQASGPGKALLRIREGKFHQVKRMLAFLGCPVTFLKRNAVGGLRLDGDLAPGQWRELTAEEAERVFLPEPPAEPEAVVKLNK